MMKLIQFLYIVFMMIGLSMINNALGYEAPTFYQQAILYLVLETAFKIGE